MGEGRVYAEEEVLRIWKRDGEQLLLVGFVCIPNARIDEEKCVLETEDGAYRT